MDLQFTIHSYQRFRDFQCGNIVEWGPKGRHMLKWCK